MSKTASSQSVNEAEKKSEYEFRPEVERHVIELDYSWKYVDTIEVRNNRLVEIADTDGYPAEDLEFHCRCGKEFSSKEDAEAHLRRRAIGAIPYPFLPRPIRWKDEVTSICNGRVRYVLNLSNSMGRLVKGANYKNLGRNSTASPVYDFDNLTCDHFQSGWRPAITAKIVSRRAGRIDTV